jgi:hypothetical protein
MLGAKDAQEEKALSPGERFAFVSAGWFRNPATTNQAVRSISMPIFKR